jgi:hypothetical protein
MAVAARGIRWEEEEDSGMTVAVTALEEEPKKTMTRTRKTMTSVNGPRPMR